MNLENLPLYIGSIFAPSITFIANLIVRATRKVIQTSGADILLLLIVFDINAIIYQNDFKRIIISNSLRDHTSTIFSGFLLLNCLLWSFAVVILEYKIRPSEETINVSTICWWLIWGITWALILTISISHVLLFIYQF